MSLVISSSKNPKIKHLIALAKPRERKFAGQFVIEGIREISLAQQGGYTLQSIFVCPAIYQPSEEYPVHLNNLEHYEVSGEVFEKIAYRQGTGGIIALAATRDLTLQTLSSPPNGLFVIIEKVEKPGNLGAILRTADAAGVHGVILCDPACDLYNPNIIRSSLGCFFTVPLAAASNEDTWSWCQSREIQAFATSLEATQYYHHMDFRGSTAFVLGAESTGLTSFWMKNALPVKIPMKGKIDSLNVSNAAAIVIYEALRQREV